jgi:hypothetical protein
MDRRPFSGRGPHSDFYPESVVKIVFDCPMSCPVKEFACSDLLVEEVEPVEVITAVLDPVGIVPFHAHDDTSETVRDGHTVGTPSAKAEVRDEQPTPDQGFLGGDDGTRTHDFLLAKQVL